MLIEAVSVSGPWGPVIWFVIHGFLLSINSPQKLRRQTGNWRIKNEILRFCLWFDEQLLCVFFFFVEKCKQISTLVVLASNLGVCPIHNLLLFLACNFVDGSKGAEVD